MVKRTKNNKNTKASHRNQLSRKSNKAYGSKNHSGIDKVSKAATNPNRPVKEGSEGFYRTKAAIKRINMYNSKPNKDRFKVPDKPVRIEPDRKWFGNTRTITQKNLETLRKEKEKQSHDTYSLFLKRSKLPQSLINPLNQTDLIMKNHAKFEETFGKKSRRTKPNLSQYTLEEYADNIEKRQDEYNIGADSNLNYLNDEEKDAPEMKFMKAGQSKRIYGELLKVVDASDVLCEILDVRDPIGTTCSYVEKFVKENCPHKHIIYVLNKCDLVPTWVTAAWIKKLSFKFPTIAFHASINNPFGKPALFQLLRQLDALHKDKKNISVGFIGYPNVGKSSIINTLKKQKCCRTAPIPGETKVWQYVSLTKRIYLIDCPGVVYEEGQSQTDRVLKSVVRAEKIEEPMEFIDGILQKANHDYLRDIYKVSSWKDADDFVGQCAKNYGKLIKGGEPDTKSMAKLLLMDWQRGKIPFFIPPPKEEEQMEVDDKENMNKKWNLEQNVKDIEMTKKEYEEEEEENGEQQ